MADEVDKDLVAVLLPRSTWMALASVVLNKLAEEARELGDEPWRPDADERREAVEDPACKLVPVLLEAVGRGPGGGHPPVQELRQVAEGLWEALDTRPSDEEWAMARELVHTEPPPGGEVEEVL